MAYFLCDIFCSLQVVPLQDMNSTPCTRSWLGLTPFDRNTCSSVSNLTHDVQQYNSGTQQEDTIETDHVELQTLEQSDSRTWKRKRDISPKQLYGKTLPSLATNTKLSLRREERDRPMNTTETSHGIAEVTATATLTVKVPVELKQEKQIPLREQSTINTAIVPKYTSPNSDIEPRHTPPKYDMEVVDIEDEFV